LTVKKTLFTFVENEGARPLSEPLNWKAHLRPEEAARLDEIDRLEAGFSKERRQIRQRARARAAKAKREAANGDR
jgi:hypothetical protein